MLLKAPQHVWRGFCFGVDISLISLKLDKEKEK